MERVTAVATKQVEDAETAIEQEQDDMRNAQQVGLTTTKLETWLEQMFNAIGDSLSDVASSDDGEDWEDEDDDEDDLAGGKIREDEEPGWVMGKISETVQYRMERFWQKQIKLDGLTLPGWGDRADYFRKRDEKNRITKLKVLAVVQPQTADDTVSSALTTCCNRMETLDSVPGKSDMPQVTSQPGSSHMSLGL